MLPLSFERARDVMVDGQLRPNKVTDERLLDAARRLRREDFLPPERQPFAYIDEDVSLAPLAPGRVLMEPVVLARLIQALAPEREEKVLVIGAGTGYGAALIAMACGARVTALEENEALAAFARSALARHAPTVRLVTGPLARGLAAEAPWGAILIEGAVAAIPEEITGLALRPLFDCATPHLPAFAPRPAFVFP
jgi:protein-L-isoaspartate(D-aspartate) O-methyltransferase